MNDITAAIGLVQLDKVPSFISRRAEIDSLYREKLSTINDLLLPPKPDFDYESSFYFFWVQTEKRDELAKFLLANGVYCTFRYWPLHKIDLFSYDNMPEFSGSEKATATTLNLPIHQSMSNEDVEYICDLIHDFMSR